MVCWLLLVRRVLIVNQLQTMTNYTLAQFGSEQTHSFIRILYVILQSVHWAGPWWRHRLIPFTLLCLSLPFPCLVFSLCIWLVNRPQSSGGASALVLVLPSCSFGRERRQLCLQPGSWRTFTRIYYSYRSVSERDLQPPVLLTSSPFCELSVQSKLCSCWWIEFLWVLLTNILAQSQGHQGLRDFLVNEQMFGAT